MFFNITVFLFWFVILFSKKVEKTHNDKLDIINQFVREITIAKFNGVYHRVKIEFNLPIEYVEDWNIDRNLNFAINFNGFVVIIPLNKKFQNKLESDDVKLESDNAILSPDTNIRLKIHNDFLDFYNVKMVPKK